MIHIKTSRWLSNRIHQKSEQNHRRRSSEEAERIRRTYQISDERQHKAICFEPNLLNISCNQFHHEFDSALFLNQIRWRNLLNYWINSRLKQTKMNTQEKIDMKVVFNAMNQTSSAKNICSSHDCVKTKRLIQKSWQMRMKCSVSL